MAAVCLVLSPPLVAAETTPVNADIEVPCVSWIEPSIATKAVLLCIHGLGLYSGSYRDFGHTVSKDGIATYAIDVRGFGSWMKSQGHERVDFKACLGDLETTLKSIRSINPGVPVFLLGESMGGAIALRATALYPQLIDGLITSVPAGERFQQKKTDLKVALHILEGYNKPFDVGTNLVSQATTKPELRQMWSKDPLDRMNLSPHELIQFQRFMNENHDSARRIGATPVLIVQGCADKLVRPEGTVELFDQLATKNKEMVLVANGEHLIFEEGQFTSDVLKTVRDWIARHVDGSVAPLSPACEVKLLEGRGKLSNGQFDQAAKLLEEAVNLEPKSSEAHLLLGQAYAGSKSFGRAREHYRLAMNSGRGGAHSQKANAALLDLPAMLNKPPMGHDGRAIAVSQGIVSSEASGSADSGMPIVLYFCADWCEPCKKLETAVGDAEAKFGGKLKFVRVDVDSPENRPLVEQYGVGPVPTVIFLKPNGDVVSYSIGFSSRNNLSEGLNSILQ